MFKSISLKWKMVFSSLFIGTFLLIQGFLAFYTKNEIINRFTEVYSVSMPKTELVGKLGHALQEGQMQVEMLGYVKDPKLSLEIYESVKKVDLEFAELIKKYRTFGITPEEQQLIEPFAKDWDVWVQETDKLIAAHKAGAKQEILVGLLTGPVIEAHEKTESHLDGMMKFHDKEADRIENEGKAAAAWGTTVSAITMSLGVILSIVVGFAFATVLSKTLYSLTHRMSQSAEATSQAGGQLASASQNLSSGTSQSAASLEETVASLEELSSQVKTNSDHAKEANHLSQKSRDSAENGEKEIARLIQSMSGIASGSKKIKEIITVIDDIAFQTNLLALNAAVEAARAGDQGKGFAVVAEAVRNLAQRSAVAAKDIANLIQENVSQSEEGAKVAESSGVVLNEIVTNVKKVSDLNNEIATASQEQAAGIAQISKAMNELDRATQSNASSSEEVSDSSKLMNEQALHLEGLVRELREVIEGQGVTGNQGMVVQVSKSFKAKQEVRRSDSQPVAARNRPLFVKKNTLGEEKVIPFETKAPKNKADLESILPLESAAGDSGRKVGKVEGF